VPEILEFLTFLYDKGLSYSTLNTARSALACFVTIKGHQSLGTHPLIKRFIKAVYQTRPVFPKYQNVWDVDIVLSYLQGLSPLCELSLKLLTLKLVMLMLLATGQRCQSIYLLDLKQIRIVDKSVVFVLDRLVKQSRPGKAQPVLTLPYFGSNESLCVFTVLKEYLQRTRGLRQGHTQLLVSYIKPYKAVSKDTISRWVQTVLVLAGINTNIFKPHSTRAASTSKAKSCGVPLSTILKAAGWSNNNTFARFYDCTVNKNANVFAEAILT
jgi:integrase